MTTPIYSSMAEVRRDHPLFFSPGTMQFFRSQIESDLITIGDRQFFITSEQFEDLNGRRDARKFTVREVSGRSRGDINTVGEHCGHATKDDAIVAVYKAAERCSFHNWGDGCVLPVGHEGEHQRSTEASERALP